MTTHHNRAEVDRRLDRLREEYDPAVRELDREFPAEVFDPLLEKAADGYTGGGYAWVVRQPEAAPALTESMPDDATEDRPHVLLILHRGDDDPAWTLPGGTREDGETYEEAAVREVREETGIDATLDAPYLALRERCRPEDGDDVCVHGLWVYFDATYDGGSIDVQPGELRGAAWFVDPPDRLAPAASDRGSDWWDGVTHEE